MSYAIIQGYGSMSGQNCLCTIFVGNIRIIFTNWNN